MLAAMMHAKVGDDVFHEDPSVNELEEKMAALFGMESALYCVSGTMSNQIAIKCSTRPGDEVICEREAHVYIYEGAGIAFNSASQVKAIAGDRGRIKAEQIPEAINPDDVHKARTSLVCLENTSNRGGGSCYDMEEIKKIREICDENKLNLHLDGARLFNALVARHEKPADYGSLFHSIPFVLIRDWDARREAYCWGHQILSGRPEEFAKYSAADCVRRDSWRQPLYTHWNIM